LYSIGVEFVAAIVFGVVIGSITAVVTSMDMNARKTAESLDAVSSFVAVRRFPEKLGRRIRRHFRHFYSLKSAIDESKIFSDLSTPLRKEVSTYLVQELMGSESFFVTLSETFWPKLLPLLRPMGFEKGEVVCVADEECTEMYVVLTGMLVGVNDVDHEFAPRKRHIKNGGSLNTLHLLGVWDECLETATAVIASETYAVSSSDFHSLFKSDSDKAQYQKMQARDVTNFKMDPTYIGAPTSFGRPLYYSCFSTVEFTLVQTYMPALPKKSQRHGPESSPKNLDMMLVIDLIDHEHSKPYNDIWRYKSTRVPSADFYGSAFWGEKIAWNDISAPFHKTAVRVRVFETDGKGKDKCLCLTVLKLSDLRSENASLTAGILGSDPALKSSDSKVAEKWEKSTPPKRKNEIEAWVDMYQPAADVPTQALSGMKSFRALATSPSHKSGSAGFGAKQPEASVRMRLLAKPPESTPLGNKKLHRARKVTSALLVISQTTSSRSSSDAATMEAMETFSRSRSPRQTREKRRPWEAPEMM
jgi:hypothetical protein